MRIAALVLTAAILGAASPPVAADEVTDTINAALEAYEAGDTKLAKEELDFAAQLISQLRADGLSGFLPAAMDGWTREDGDTQALGAGAFGGGMMASATYTNAAGDSVEMQLMANNAMVTSMAAMFQNTALLGSMGKVTRIGREKAVITKQGDVQMLFNGKVMIQVDGSASVDDKKAYLSAIAFDDLKAF